jgi:hypothetical protein
MKRKTCYLVAVFIILSVQAVWCGNVNRAETVPLYLDASAPLAADGIGPYTGTVAGLPGPGRFPDLGLYEPFITTGVTPDGKPVEYFHFRAKRENASFGFVFSTAEEDASSAGQKIVKLIRTLKALQSSDALRGEDAG